MKCPNCSSELKSVVYEGMEIYECPSCEGNWLEGKELSAIVRVREEVFSPEEIKEVIQKRKPVTSIIDSPERTLLCPECGLSMRKINYAYSTGVIIDRCPKCNGIWLDKGELKRIQIIMEEEEKNLPEVMKRLEPVLTQMKLRHKDLAERQFEDASSTSFLAKLPGMKSLVKFLVERFD